MCKNLEKIKKINKTIIHKDDSIDSFEKQLVDLISGDFDITYPMVISEDSSMLNYISLVNEQNPLIMNVTTFIKLQNKHNLEFKMIKNIIALLNDSVLAFESLTEKESVVILTNEFDKTTGSPYIITCRFDKKVYSLSVNEITSLYDKQKFDNMLIRTFDENKMFYKNEKTEQYFNLNGLYLSQALKYALSCNYDKKSFTKSQVLIDLTKDINCKEEK